ncbi:peptidase family M48-domain-containing protein [Lipomyces arxii]|uniref:peptidase family M48-domain-containing protein n=1 Tax=Lipomyces arxii TaxID=56418 RepID=UPI0034CF26CF
MMISPSFERWMGDYQYQSVLHEYRGKILPDHHPMVADVQRVMAKLIKVSGITDVEWKIHVIADPRLPPNAFVLPGGKVFVFSSILPLCKNDDGLATVLAHETAHQVARHTGEKMSRMPFTILAVLGVSIITGSSRVISNLMALLFDLPSSRQMESEADYIGLLMMSQACFNPREAVAFWDRMSKAGLHAPLEYFSDHPSDATRVEHIREWMPQATHARELANCQSAYEFMDAFRRF